MPMPLIPDIAVFQRKLGRAGAISVHVRTRALWGLTRNLRKPRNTAKCLPTPSLCFGNSGSAFCCPGAGRQPAVKPTAPLSRHYPRDARDSGSGLGAAPRSKFALQRQPSVRQAALEHLATPMPFVTGRFRACVSFSGSVQPNSMFVRRHFCSKCKTPERARVRTCARTTAAAHDTSLLTEVFPAPAFGECRHRGLARRFVAARTARMVQEQQSSASGSCSMNYNPI
jgi:hypothetical protein